MLFYGTVRTVGERSNFRFVISRSGVRVLQPAPINCLITIVYVQSALLYDQRFKVVSAWGPHFERGAGICDALTEGSN